MKTNIAARFCETPASDTDALQFVYVDFLARGRA